MTILGTALLALLPTGASMPPPANHLTSGGLVWRFPGGIFRPSVVIAERGGQVLVHYMGQTWLLSAFDSNPPVPVWFDYTGGGEVAARESDVFLSLDIQKNSPGSADGIVTKRTSSSAVPVWTHLFDDMPLVQVDCCISRDGRVIIASSGLLTSPISELRVLDPETGAALRTYVMPTPMYRLALSPDGSFAAFSDASYPTMMTRVIDVGTGAEIFNTPGTVPRKQALSNDGRVLLVEAREAGGVSHARAFVREGDSYREVLDIRAPTDTSASQMAVSDDGAVVAGAWYYAGSPGRFVVRAFEVATGAMTMERELPVPSLENLPRGVAISADGSRFVVGSFGDGAGLASELAVYSPSQNDPIMEYPDGGSVVDVDISTDGKRFVAARGQGYGGGQGGGAHYDVEMYETGGEDLIVRGRPSIGETVSFELHATPGAHAFLLSSRRLAIDPFDLPGGTLFLGRSSLATAPIGVVPPSGVATHPMSIAADPALVGRTAYYQGLTTAPRTLTRDWVQLTILP